MDGLEKQREAEADKVYGSEIEPRQEDALAFALGVQPIQADQGAMFIQGTAREADHIDPSLVFDSHAALNGVAVWIEAAGSERLQFRRGPRAHSHSRFLKFWGRRQYLLSRKGMASVIFSPATAQKGMASRNTIQLTG